MFIPHFKVDDIFTFQVQCEWACDICWTRDWEVLNDIKPFHMANDIEWYY